MEIYAFKMTSAQDLSLLRGNSPNSLLDICMDYISSDLDVISTLELTDRNTFLRKLHHNIILPREICEKLIQNYQKNRRIDDEFANIFKDRWRTKLNRICLRKARISESGLLCFMLHKPVHLELIQCEYLSQKCFEIINANSENLISLKFRRSRYVTMEDIPDDQIPHLVAPHLKRLTLFCKGLIFFPFPVLRPLRNLTHLDVSELVPIVTSDVFDQLINLKSLILFNVPWTKEIVEQLPKLKSLEHLDLSQTTELGGKFNNPNEVLSFIVKRLPKLVSLDISGTNLAGSGAAAVVPAEEGTSDQMPVHVRCDIPGLVTRVDTPLEYLGLFGTHHGACKRHDIPAKLIAGDANEEQILTAAVANMSRPLMLSRVLNEIYYMFRYENNTYIGRSLLVVLDAMYEHLYDKYIQISGSATLFYIMRGKEKDRIGIQLRHRIIKALLDSMEAHFGDEIVMRNGCLTLSQFKIPVDVLFEYERVVTILLSSVADVVQEGFVQRIAIYLLNSLACQVDNKQKLVLGRSGAISTMLNLISERLIMHICDDVLEVAWSTMWNVTDETPMNSLRFLENGGMELFLACLKSFPNKEELLRNMMGLLGNVAEVSELRPELMNTLFLNVFYDLLNSSSDGIEVSYNAAGVLAHIASDGVDAWTVEEPERDAVMMRMEAAIKHWDIRAERNINYRSFDPILVLLEADHTPQCQLWAIWALANLTSVYPEKYCELLKRENGVNLLKELLEKSSTTDDLKELACIVINNCAQFAARYTGLPPEVVYFDN